MKLDKPSGIKLKRPQSRNDRLISYAFKTISDQKLAVNSIFFKRRLKTLEETITRLSKENKDLKSKTSLMNIELLKLEQESIELKTINERLIDGL